MSAAPTRPTADRGRSSGPGGVRLTRRPRTGAVPSTVSALLALVLLVGACSGGDDPGTGLGPEAPNLTILSTTTVARSAPPSTDVAVDGATATTSSTGAPTSATTTGAPARAPTTIAVGAGDTTATTMAPATTVDPEGPVVRIGLDAYAFTMEECLFFDGVDVVVTGPGRAPDGTPVYLSMQIDTLRIDIGTDQPSREMEEHWLAGVGAEDDLEVTVDGFLVTVTGTFVSSPGGESVHGELVVDCPLG